MRAPYYRIVVADSRSKRDGRVIEEIGKYHPTEEPSYIEVNSDRAQYWLGVGAQPTDQVANILKITGDWQKYKGLPGQEGTLKVSAARADAAAAIQAASDEAEKLKAKVAASAAESAAEAAVDAEVDAARGEAAAQVEADAEASATDANAGGEES